MTGRVVEARAAGRLSGAAVLTIELVSLKLATPDGQQQIIAIVTKLLSSKNGGNGTGTAAKTAGGAGLGAVIGALAGGGAGAGVGAAGGGAVELDASGLTPGKQIDLKPEALLQFQTDAAFEIMPASATVGHGSGGIGSGGDVGYAPLPRKREAQRARASRTLTPSTSSASISA